MPRLTVLLSTFNRPKRLLNAAHSVLKQTFADLQLVILDDNSPLPEQREAIDYLLQYDRVRAVRGFALDKTKLSTFGRLINVGLQLTDSEFVSYICDSAEYFPQRCERLAAHLDKHPGCQVVWDQQHYLRVDADGEPTFKEDRIEDPGKHEVHQGQGFAERIAGANFIDHNSTMERRCQHPWSEDVQHWNVIDWERWARMARAGVRFDMIGWLGEIKRVGPDSTGLLIGGGKSLADVVAIRTGARAS